jgi:hypothetical protein
MSDAEFALFLMSPRGRLLGVDGRLRTLAPVVGAGASLEAAAVVAGIDLAAVRTAWDLERDSLSGDVRARMEAQGWRWEPDATGGRGSFAREGEAPLTWEAAVDRLRVQGPSGPDVAAIA